MKITYLLVFVFFMVLTGCQNLSTNINSSLNSSSSVSVLNPYKAFTDTNALDNFVMAYKAGKKEFTDRFNPNALLFTHNMEYYNGISNISQFFTNSTGSSLEFQEYKSVYFYRRTPQISYELGLFIDTNNLVTNAFSIIWRNTSGDDYKCTLLMWHKKDSDVFLTNEIEQAINKWESTVSLMVNASSNIAGLYCTNGIIFFDSEPFHVGRSNIQAFWSFVNNYRNYQDDHYTYFIETINSNMVFEDGYYSENYYGTTGFYTVLWIKSGNDWQIMLDSSW